jgi:hypothetical protein
LGKQNLAKLNGHPEHHEGCGQAKGDCHAARILADQGNYERAHDRNHDEPECRADRTETPVRSGATKQALGESALESGALVVAVNVYDDFGGARLLFDKHRVTDDVLV